jgi:hypothetical protein
MQLHLFYRSFCYALARRMFYNREYPCCYHQLHASPHALPPLLAPLRLSKLLYPLLPPR